MEPFIQVNGLSYDGWALVGQCTKWPPLDVWLKRPFFILFGKGNSMTRKYFLDPGMPPKSPNNGVFSYSHSAET